MRNFGVAHLVALALAAATPAFAQSADDIINSLKPTSSQLTGPTRGIRPVATPQQDEAPAAPAAVHRTSFTRHVAAAPAESDASGMPSASLTVNFVTASADLTPSAREKLDQLGKALTSPALQTSHFRIEGHTDTVGDAATNKDLSARRAQAVTAYLEQNFGIDSARLEAVGLGDEGLAVPTPAQTPEPRNRRVKIVNLNG